jgi:hypothetical protein
LQPDYSVQNFLIAHLPVVLLKTAGLRVMTPRRWAIISGDPEQIVIPLCPECGNLPQRRCFRMLILSELWMK